MIVAVTTIITPIWLKIAYTKGAARASGYYRMVAEKET
jgi:hypothetical protein